MTSLSKGNGDFSMPWLAVLLVFVWLGIFNTVMAAENQPPSAIGQTTLSTKEDTKKSITLSGKDPEKKKLTYAIVRQPAHGTLTLKGNKATYVPTKDYFSGVGSPDSFTFKVNDGLVDSAPAMVGIIVTPVNDKPVAVGGNVIAVKDSVREIALSATDVEEGVLTYIPAKKSKKGGAVVVKANNIVTYTPKKNFVGADSFTFTVKDSQKGVSAAATMKVMVNATNTAPKANAGADQNLDEKTTVTLDGSASTDTDGMIVSYEWVQTAGTVVTLSGATTANPTFTTPDVAANETLMFELTVTDNNGMKASQATSIHVKDCNCQLQDNIVLIDDEVKVSDIINNDDGSGSLKIEIDKDKVDDLKDKIVILPTKNELDDISIVKISDISVANATSNPDMVVADVVYTIPAIDEIFDQVHYDAESALEKAEVTHIFHPQSYIEDVTVARAAKSVSQSADDQYKVEWFPNVKVHDAIKVTPSSSDKKIEVSTTFNGLEIVRYSKKGGAAVGSVSIGGTIKRTINKENSKISFDKALGSSLDEEFLLEYEETSALTLKASGKIEASLSQAFNNGFKCGVSEIAVDTLLDGTEIKLNGAKWQDNICLGGFRVGWAGGILATKLSGNGESEAIKVPLALDVFLTMDTSLSLNGEFKASLVKNSKGIKGVKLNNGILSSINTEIDPDTGKAPEIKTTIEGKVEGKFISRIGMAAGVKFGGIYPAVAEVFGEIEAAASIKPAFSNGNGDVCSTITVKPRIAYYLAVGMSTSLSQKISIAGNASETKWSAGVNVAYEDDIWKPENGIIKPYKSCADDAYDISFSVDNSHSNSVLLGNPSVKSKTGDVSYGIEQLSWVIHDSSLALVTDVMNVSGLSLKDLAPGVYTSLLTVQLTDGKVIQEEETFEVILHKARDLNVEAGDGKLTIEWLAEDNVNYKVCVSKPDVFVDCFKVVSDSSNVRAYPDAKSPLVVDGLNNNEAYKVIVVAENKGNHVSTEPLQVTPTAGLSAPSNVKATSGDGSVTLSWDAVPNAESYRICLGRQHSEIDGSSTSVLYICLPNLPWGDYSNWWGAVSSTTATLKTLPDSSSPLVNGTTYTFQVLAQAADGSKSPFSAEVTATPQEFTSGATGKLNDTGITTCGDYADDWGNSDVSCSLLTDEDGDPVPPGQDGTIGRDVTANDDNDGHAGFSFTKISSSGAELSASEPEWSCVKDNVTGLMWEVKTDDSGLHDKDWTYSWYEPDSSRNGGNVGTQNAGSCGVTSQCDIYGYVQAVNTAGWCGYKNWRMPTANELANLADSGINNEINTQIDANYFPNTQDFWYWSSSPDARYSERAWHVIGDHIYNYAFKGGAGFENHITADYVRLVRDTVK